MIIFIRSAGIPVYTQRTRGVEVPLFFQGGPRALRTSPARQRFRRDRLALLLPNSPDTSVGLRLQLARLLHPINARSPQPNHRVLLMAKPPSVAFLLPKPAVQLQRNSC